MPAARPTFPIRVIQIAANLVMHPSYLMKYTKHNVLSKESTLDLKLPWMSYSIIDYLDHALNKDMDLFEYGSGGSSLFFSERCRQVYSMESKSEWLPSLEQAIQQSGRQNLKFSCHAYDSRNSEAFKSSEYLHSIDHYLDQYDAIVIDCVDPTFQIRPICFEKAEEKVKPGGMIILDDFWRYRHLLKLSKSRSFHIFNSVGPGAMGMRMSAVFHY